MAKLLLSFKEIRVAESNGNVRIFTQAQIYISVRMHSENMPKSASKWSPIT